MNLLGQTQVEMSEIKNGHLMRIEYTINTLDVLNFKLTAGTSYHHH